ncbi:GNAT family N-acetyltransferase [Rhodococcoides fascians]|uniref:GNAT family N-acetyltransferase n=1 Tax=Rhodococcoides fascians TaxID=1828 RepID=UPI001F5B2B2C|nr:GNAT family N-acetyltransferase [Rhodococcus fascians]
MTTVPIELLDMRRGGESRYSWQPPFDLEIKYEQEHWWDYVPYHFDDPWYVQVQSGGAEIARIELDDPGDINHDYTNAPELGPERLEIQTLEVAASSRERGIGTRVVQALMERHPHRRLFAYSEEAHEFWVSLGWQRFDHPEGEQFHRPLFIQRR